MIYYSYVDIVISSGVHGNDGSTSHIALDHTNLTRIESTVFQTVLEEMINVGPQNDNINKVYLIDGTQASFKFNLQLLIHN